MKRKIIISILILTLFVGLVVSHQINACAEMSDYCYIPPFLNTAVPPLVMLIMGRDHRLYYGAYNDASDLDGDGKLDITYKHSIDYYGYFDVNKCYDYDGSMFVPVAAASSKFCSSQWSGNFLNWLSMSRMDVLRKVLYGGNRTTDSGSLTVLSSVFIPQNAHSWGKEYTGSLCSNGSIYTNMCSTNSDCESGYSCVNKSTSLTPNPKPGACRTPAGNAAWGTKNGKILRVIYEDGVSKATANHTALVNSYDGCKIKEVTYVTGINIPSSSNNITNGNYLFISQFQIKTTGQWDFSVDGDDSVEFEIRDAGGTLLPTVSGSNPTGYYGDHAFCNCNTYTARFSLTTGNWYTIIARHREQGGNDGVVVKFKKSTEDNSKWVVYDKDADNIKTNLQTLQEPDTEAINACRLKDANFVATGTPLGGGVDVACATNTRHLYCVTSVADGTAATRVPVIREALNDANRIWDWASTERAVCSGPDTPASYRRGPVGTRTDITDRYLNIKVCDPNIGLESNCKYYPGGGGIYKPIGLMQKYGEGDAAGTKVCSKNPSKQCNADSGCIDGAAGEGFCITQSRMYFGLLTGSYDKHMSGGVLRKNVWDLVDEQNPNTGYFQTSESETGNIFIPINNMRNVDFSYSDFAYSCGWITNGPMTEGSCKMWGNPVAEMMYETLRYFAGLGTSSGGGETSAYSYTDTGSSDKSIGLSQVKWGIHRGSTYYRPYEVFPTCAKPFMLVLSDINTSFDDDQLPGSHFSTFSTSSLLNFNAKTQADTVGTGESIAGNSWFVGVGNDSGTTNLFTDFVCTKKYVSNLGSIQGVCPEEPTKRGTFYASAVAYYGRTMMNTNYPSTPNVNTFAVALASPIPSIKLNVNGKEVTFIPTGKSVSGGSSVYTNCSAKCPPTLETDVDGTSRLVIPTNCGSLGGFCPTNQIVNVYIDRIDYATNYAKFRINFEDVEQGADHDMDAIVKYEVCTKQAQDAGVDFCGISTIGALSADQVNIRLDSDYAAGGIDQVLGFVVSGTGTKDGTYLVVKDDDVSDVADGDTPAEVANLPRVWSKKFTVTGSSSGFLKDPLWYAAKWGGFDDKNSNKQPDQTSEWDAYNNDTGGLGSDGLPDSYFRVTNPLKLEQQLERAFAEILRRASSGTTVVALPPTQSREAFVITQAYFYPERAQGGVTLKWLGYFRMFWADAVGYLRNNSDTAGESDTVKVLDLIGDQIMAFVYSNAEGTFMARMFTDSNADSVPDNGAGVASCAYSEISMDNVTPLMEAGQILKNTNPGDRRIFTTVDGTSQVDFSESTVSLLAAGQKVWTYPDSGLGTCDANCAASVIKYARGYDWPTPSGGAFRPRQSEQLSGEYGLAWKLGDVIFSTPKISPSRAVNGYYTRYGDATYQQYINTKAVNFVPTAIMGANDGMVHAFRIGKMEDISPPTITKSGDTILSKLIAKVTDALSGGKIGKEQWAFVPKNALPYLRYYCQENYCHIPMVDATFTIVDASIGENGAAGATGARDVDSWRRLLIGTMGFGGKKFTASDSTVYSSSVFILDITGSDPQLLWESPLPDNTLTTGTPGIVRLGDKTKNGEWYVVIGSGPVSLNNSALSYSGTPNVYVFNLRNGSVSATLPVTGETGTAIGDFLATDLDYPVGDYQVDDLYFGTYGDTGGTTQKGGMFRLRIRNGATYQSPANWNVEKLVNIPDTADEITLADNRPVFGAPNISIDESNQLWLYYSTGLYVTQNHIGTTNEFLFGIKEKTACWQSGGASCTYSQYLDTSGYVLGDALATKYSCTCTGGILVSNNTCPETGCTTLDCISGSTGIVTATSGAKLISGGSCPVGATEEAVISCVESQLASKDMWINKVIGGKMYAQPFVGGGIVTSTVFIPSGNICDAGGNTSLLAVHYTTGTSYFEPALLIEGGTTLSGGKVTINKMAFLVKGAPPFKQSLVAIAQGDSYKLFTQSNNAGLTAAGVKTSVAYGNRFVQWLTK